MIRIREAVEQDVEQIRDIYLATYGQHYAHPKYYETLPLTKLVYSDDSLLLVAEDESSGKILGTASVLLDTGAFADLVGEFGRLAVDPEARQQGIGRLLMEARIEQVQDRLHVGIVENRTRHSYSQKISVAHGFVPVGFLPLKLLTDQRESIALYVRYFQNSLSLRRNNPCIIPEVHALAKLSFNGCGLVSDAIVDEQAASYPYDDRFDIDQLTTEGYAALLRFQRGRVRRREILGPMRLHYGLFKLKARNSNYLIARDRDQIVGAIGYTYDTVERAVRIFELISLSDRPVRFLINRLVQKCRESHEADYLEVDVNAHSPRMQRTLLESGFLPSAYIPAMAFHEVERLDVVKMSQLLVPARLDIADLYTASRPIADVVISQFVQHEVLPRIAAALPDVALLTGFNSEQTRLLASLCSVKQYPADERILCQGDTGAIIHLVLSGKVDVTVTPGRRPVGTIGPGECLGEMSLLSSAPHSASAIANGPVETAAVNHQDLERLVRLRPDIGVVLYRNLANGLGDKLRRTDQSLAK